MAVTFSALAACSSSLFNKPDPNAAANEPPEQLYNQALASQAKNEWRRSALKFAEVVKFYPGTDWARKATLMAAYSFYEGGDHDETISYAGRYLAAYPTHPDAAYAQYLMGSAYYDQIPDVSRDQSSTEKALVLLDDVSRKWPKSEYAVSARRKAEVARDQLAGREMMIGRQYLKQRNFAGAVNRFRVVVSQFQATRHVEEALARLAEAYLAMGITNEATTAAAVLGHNFPDSPWYKDTYTLINSRGLAPREDSGSWISRAFTSFTRNKT